MKSFAFFSLILLGPGVLNSMATVPGRYQTIVDRNSFGLLPPPLIEPVTASPTPPSDIKLTGFSNFSGDTKVYLVVQPKDAKTTPRYLSLAAGASDGSVEVIEISAENGEVKIRNSGTEMVLTLKNNGFKASPSSIPNTSAPNPVPSPVNFSTGGVSAVPTPSPNFGESRDSQAQSVVWKSKREPRALPSAPGISYAPSAPSAPIGGGGGNLVSAPGQNLGGTTLAFNNAGTATGNSSVVYQPGLTTSEEKRDLAVDRFRAELQQEHARQNNITLPPLPPLPGK